MALCTLRRYDVAMQSLVRCSFVFALLTLAGCAGSESSADLAPAAAPPPPPVAQAEPAPAPPSKRGAPAGRSQQAAPPPPPAPAKVASTPEEVRAQCWMKFENDKKIKNIDARAEAVDKCIAESSRNQPPAR